MTTQLSLRTFLKAGLITAAATAGIPIRSAGAANAQWCTLLDLQKCIACGACAANCPTGAMRIEDRGDERLLILCGTILNRQKLIFCSDCGKAMGPKKYLDFINSRVKLVGQIGGGQVVCETCARTRTARFNVDTLPV